MFDRDFDLAMDQLSPADFEREFGTPDERFDAFGSSGWTGELIEEYEAYLETAESNPF